MKRYHLNYFCSAVSLFGALIGALIHHLGLLLFNFFFAVWNWYVAEYLRGLEQTPEEIEDVENDDTEDQ